MSRDATRALHLKNLTKTYGKRTAVDCISLEVPHGCIFAFLGPNGAGKSTTVNMAAGFIRPTSGELYIAGRSIRRDLLSTRLYSGVLPENPSLFGRLTLWEHLTLAGNLYGLSLSRTESRARSLLEFLGLWNQRGVYACEASHGMKKKIAMALALVHAPRLLILDEPFEGVDPATSKNIQNLLAVLVKKGITVFLTSHILEYVQNIADHAAIIAEGRIVFSSPVKDILKHGRGLADIFAELTAGEPGTVEEMAWLY